MARRRIFDPVGDSAYQKKYRETHREKLSQQNIEYKRINEQKIREKRKPYREVNAEKIRKQVWKTKLKARYGLTPEQYFELMRRHKESCGICKSTDRLGVDHNHTTGKIRGILCGNCNRALGLFRDNPSLLSRAIRYLKANN